MKKKLLVVGGILLAIFVLLNVSWFVWRSTYNRYTENMEKEVYSSSLAYDYRWEDEDGYRYVASYPGYLSFGGMLAVYITQENTTEGGILNIYPSVSGKYDYLYVFSSENHDYLMDIDAQGNSLSDENNELVERYKDDIDILLKKAKDMWNLEG